MVKRPAKPDRSPFLGLRARQKKSPLDPFGLIIVLWLVKWKFLLFLCWFILFCAPVLAQSKRYSLCLRVDSSLWVKLPADAPDFEPASLHAAEGWQIDSIGVRSLRMRAKISDTVCLHYRALPAQTSAQFHKNPLLLAAPSADSLDALEQLMGGGYTYNPQRSNPNSAAEGIEMGKLDYSGTFARAISVGNNQSLVQDATFNLQLAGKLGDVEVLAAITDNNSPVQPQGNTQKLQDFDKVFIQFKLQRQFLLAGDYNLQNAQNNYFARYNRRLQGAQLHNEFKLNKRNDRLITHNSFALARGKFARNQFNAEEGNQGPYKLRGAGGERFIIVIAGTEQVFVDGQLMQRGADADYVIDYNLAEIRFTNRQMMTKDKRIQVEFTYNDLSYVRSLYDIQAEWQTERISLRLTHFSEQDARNQSTQQLLNDTTRAILQSIGDSLQYAYTSGITQSERAAAAAGVLLYRLVDTTFEGRLYDSVLVFGGSDTTAIYSVQFSPVSAGGDYVRLQNGANGSVYAWTPPDPLTGLSRGTHAPVTLLSAPKQQQLSSIGFRLKTNKNGFIDAEGALSKYDINTFSGKDSEDDRGSALRVQAEQSFALSPPDSLSKKPRSTLTARLHYERTSLRFLPLDPYRAREFQRDWNTSALPASGEHWARASLSLQTPQIQRLQYEAAALWRDSSYTGYKQDLSANVFLWDKRLQIQTNSSLLHNKSGDSYARFDRPNIEAALRLPKLGGLTIAARYEREQNALRDANTDSLRRESLYFQLLRLSAALPLAEKQLDFRLSLQRRMDYAPDSAKFSAATRADEANAALRWQSDKGRQSIDANFGYRRLDILDPDTSRTRLRAQNTYLGRGEYNLNLKKGFLRLNTVYELGSGQQQKIEYQYIQTDAGNGTHVWIDRNADGQQQQSEFELAPFLDQANFLRLTILSPEFVRTQNVAFAQSLDCAPRLLFARRVQALDSMKFVRFLTRFSTRSLLRIERNSFAALSVQPFNPFLLAVSDTSLVSLNSQLQNSLFFNRANPNFSLEFVQNDTRNKILLATGFETRTRREFIAQMRIKLSTKFLFSQQFSVGKRGNTSQFFPQRDYDIAFLFFEPQISYLQASALRLNLRYAYKKQDNRIGEQENNRSHTASLEATYARSQKWNIRTQFSLVHITYTGELNTPVEFALNEGLRAGTNLLWSINIDRQIAKNVQFSLQYEGRKSNDTPFVHIGRAQIRANF